MDILIVKLSALGDVLRTTSLLKPLHAKHPGARISWVTSEAAYPLLDGNPHLFRTLVWGPETREFLARQPFDLILSMEEDPEIARFLAHDCITSEAAGVVWTARGLRYTPSSASYYGMSLLNRDPDGTSRTADTLKKANAKTYIRLWSEILGLPELPPEDTRPILALMEEDRAAARKFLDSHTTLAKPRIGFNSSAGERWPAKRLSAPRAAALCRAFHARFKSPVVLLGGPDEAERNTTIAREAGEAAVDAGTSHPLRSFAGIVEALDAVVTSDSLAFHIANALSKPAVVFVGPTSPAELDLFGKSLCLLPPVECVDFYKPRCTREPSCLDQISDATYIRAVEQMLGP